MYQCPVCYGDDLEDTESGIYCHDCDTTYTHDSTEDDYEEVDEEDL